MAFLPIGPWAQVILNPNILYDNAKKGIAMGSDVEKITAELERIIEASRREVSGLEVRLGKLESEVFWVQAALDTLRNT